MPSDRIEPPFVCPGCGTEYDTPEKAARCYGIEPPMSDPWDGFQVIGMTDDDLRRFALAEQGLHDPAKQDDNPYERCALCHYTRHPCSTYDLATAVLQLLDRGRTDP